jgi:hypothetical protein
MIVAMIQERKEEINRVVRFPVTDAESSPDMPGPLERALKFLAFDKQGQPIASEGSAGAYPVSAFMGPVVSALDMLAAQKKLGLVPEALNVLLQDILSYVPVAPLSRAARTPPSFNCNMILDSGLYMWSDGSTTNFPPPCAANDKFALTVSSGKIGINVVIIQRLVSITAGPTSTKYKWQRQSENGGGTWTPWLPEDVPAIGDVYIRLPGMPDPATRYPGTAWDNISSHWPGDFFRVGGGAAEAFANQVAPQAAQNLLHDHGGATGGMSANNPHTHSQVGGSGGAGNYPRANNYTDAVMVINATDINHTHSIPANGGADLHPNNRTIQIYQRAAA